jgi:hypothetical protein
MSNDRKTADDLEDISAEELVRGKVNLETATIAWKELERFFANGSAIYVAPELDLVDVAYLISQDDKQGLEPLVKAEQVCPVKDHQAIEWLESDTDVWAVVVRPLVLVQVVQS